MAANNYMISFSILWRPLQMAWYSTPFKSNSTDSSESLQLKHVCAPCYLEGIATLLRFPCEHQTGPQIQLQCCCWFHDYEKWRWVHVRAAACRYQRFILDHGWCALLHLVDIMQIERKTKKKERERKAGLICYTCVIYNNAWGGDPNWQVYFSLLQIESTTAIIHWFECRRDWSSARKPSEDALRLGRACKEHVHRQ